VAVGCKEGDFFSVLAPKKKKKETVFAKREKHSESATRMEDS
jgi:hypothetical protein